jgi:D-arabinose 1-dehydrogenase-like Zn-dependent alcohol dehydrogenase
MPEDQNSAASALQDMNAIIGAIIPSIGLIGGLASVIIQLAKKNGIDVGTFEQEVVKYNTAQARVLTNYERFKAKYPTAPIPDEG